MEVHVSNTTWLLEFGPASHFFGSGSQDILCWLMNVDRSRVGLTPTQSPKYQSRTLLANPTVRKASSKLPPVIILAFLLQYEKSSLEVEDR